MKSDSTIIYITIGGVEYPTKVLYKDVEGFFSEFNKIVAKSNKNPQLIVPNTFFFNVLWKCLVKSGYLLWKKPFRSKQQMIDSLLYDELSDVTMFVSKHIMKFESDSEDKSKKKQNQIK